MPVLAVLVISLTWTDGSVSLADLWVVQRLWNNDVDPLPAEPFLGASAVSLLTVTVVWKFLALALPNSTVTWVVESWRVNYINPVPAEAIFGASVVPVLTVIVASLLRTDRSVSVADRWVVERW